MQVWVRESERARITYVRPEGDLRDDYRPTCRGKLRRGENLLEPDECGGSDPVISFRVGIGIRDDDLIGVARVRETQAQKDQGE